MPQTIDIATEIAALREQYRGASTKAQRGHSFLIYGDFGTCKTGVVGLTAPRPVYFHSFDPKGTDMARLQPLIDSGDVLVERFEDENPAKPTEFDRWKKRWTELMRTDIFDQVGTFCLDSLTFWGEAILNRVMRGIQEDTIIDQGKWGQQQNIMRTYIRQMISLPCNFVLLAHQDYTVNKTTDRMKTHIATTGKSQFKLPGLFEEVYQVDAKTNKDSELEPSFLTKPKGGAQARTKMGDGIFDTTEPADISALMRKAKVLD